MSVKSSPFYWAECDYPDCTSATSDHDAGPGWLHESEQKLAAVFTPPWEGGLEDWGWLQTDDGKHYCGEHTTYNDDDVRVPKPDLGTTDA